MNAGKIRWASEIKLIRSQKIRHNPDENVPLNDLRFVASCRNKPKDFGYPGFELSAVISPTGLFKYVNTLNNIFTRSEIPGEIGMLVPFERSFSMVQATHHGMKGKVKLTSRGS